MLNLDLTDDWDVNTEVVNSRVMQARELINQSAESLAKIRERSILNVQCSERAK